MNTAVTNPYQRAFLLLSITELKTQSDNLPEYLKNLFDVHGTTLANLLQQLMRAWSKKGHKPKMIDHIFKPTPKKSKKKSEGKLIEVPVMGGGKRTVRIMN